MKKIVENLENTTLMPIDGSSVFDDKIDEWHNSDTPLSLYEYLGLTEEQFKIWLKTPEEIEKDYR